MPFDSVSPVAAFDIFLLLLIGIGPKIALVPFLEVTASMDEATKGRVTRKMLTTAAVVALILIVFGRLLTNLLHFSTSALSVAGGIILLVIAVSMVLQGEDSRAENPAGTRNDPMRLAVYPLAIPYLLNPAGIVVLVTASAEAASPGVLLVVVGALVGVLLLDVVVFRWANRVSEHLDENRMLVTEKVFGILLAALGVQLMLDGLSTLGVIHLVGH